MPPKRSGAAVSQRRNAACICGRAAGGWREGVNQIIPPDHQGRPPRQARTVDTSDAPMQ